MLASPVPKRGVLTQQTGEPRLKRVTAVAETKTKYQWPMCSDSFGHWCLVIGHSILTPRRGPVRVEAIHCIEQVFDKLSAFSVAVVFIRRAKNGRRMICGHEPSGILTLKEL